MKEEHLKLIPRMDARVNERIKAQFEEADRKAKAMSSVNSSDNPGDISDYKI